MLTLGLHKDNAIIIETTDGTIRLVLSEHSPANNVKIAIEAPRAVSIGREHREPIPRPKNYTNEGSRHVRKLHETL